MMGYERAWFTPAMILSLLTVGISFLIAVAFIGVSPIGEQMIGWEGTTSYALNATVWNTYSSLGDTLWFFFVLLIAVALGLLFYISSKWMGLENENEKKS